MCLALPSAKRPEGTHVWDLPTRLFHWTLAILVVVCFLTGWNGGNWMVWHGRAGSAIVGLIAFRLVWGVIGSTYARFATFVRGPQAIVAYLKGQWCGAGHNPLGALSVLGLLGLMLFQSITGLFGNDDISFNGPLYALVSKESSDWLVGWHRQTKWLLLALIVLHLGAIGFYRLVKKDDLVKPMLTGRKTFCVACKVKDAKGGGFRAFLLATAIGIFAWWAASGGLLPPPPPVSTTIPAW